MRDKALGNDFNLFMKTVAYVAAIAFVFFIMFMVLAYCKISTSAFATYDNYNKIPYNKVGLLLGTSPNTTGGVSNDFFTNRIIAAATLYKLHKIDYILVSGDNRSLYYNEPKYMTKALRAQGIPEDRIIQDAKGIRTLDSVVRTKEIFLQKRVTIISQAFHNERAIFIAKENGLDAIGFNASDPIDKWKMFNINVREFFARILCIFDVYFFNDKGDISDPPIAIAGDPEPKKLSNVAKDRTSMPKKTSNKLGY